jgi:hypothetical protein
MSKQNGGPAFPESCNGQIIPGMTLRDYFAGQVLAGYSSLDFIYQNIGHPAVARMAYDAADAMLAERAKA